MSSTSKERWQSGKKESGHSSDAKLDGMPIKETDEAACVAWLMRLYQEMTT